MKKSDYKPGVTIKTYDKMGNDGRGMKYSYKIVYKAGTNLRKSGDKSPDYNFFPAFTPKQMLKMGVFEGKYLNDMQNEFPKNWFGKTLDKPDPKANYFGVKSRMSLLHWKEKKWIGFHKKDKDVRGWFQWYCRYWLGRRIPEVDKVQIKRWRAFARHYAQAKNKGTAKQKQMLLQWSWPID
jgi:hypothetical protein